METKTYEQRVLIPDENKWLYNEKDNVISDKVYLGINADESEWVMIDEEQKQEIEKQWEEQMNSENATEENYLEVLERLGVY